MSVDSPTDGFTLQCPGLSCPLHAMLMRCQAIITADDEPVAMQPDDLVSALFSMCGSSIWRSSTEGTAHLAKCAAASRCYLGVKLLIRLSMSSGSDAYSLMRNVQEQMTSVDGYTFLDDTTLLRLARQDPMQVWPGGAREPARLAVVYGDAP
jgi:hypothetical protein